MNHILISGVDRANSSIAEFIKFLDQTPASLPNADKCKFESNRVTECVGDADAAGLAVVAAHLETAILSIPRQPARAPLETAFPSYLLN